MVSWWVLHLAKGSRSDFNNGPEITRIMAALLFPRIYLSPTRIMAFLPGYSNFSQMEDTSVQVPTCGLLMSAISGQGSKA